MLRPFVRHFSVLNFSVFSFRPFVSVWFVPCQFLVDAASCRVGLRHDAWPFAAQRAGAIQSLGFRDICNPVAGLCGLGGSLGILSRSGGMPLLRLRRERIPGIARVMKTLPILIVHTETEIDNPIFID